MDSLFVNVVFKAYEFLFLISMNQLKKNVEQMLHLG